MSMSAYSEKAMSGGQPQYPGVGRYPSAPGPTMMSTSFMSSPPGPGDLSRSDTSMVQLLSPTDRTQYTVDYRHAVLALFMCPLLGLISFFHTRKARKELSNGNKVRAASHIEKSNTFYGYALFLGFAFYLFILAVIFVVVTHYLISIRHYSVSIPNKFVNFQ